MLNPLEADGVEVSKVAITLLVWTWTTIRLLEGLKVVEKLTDEPVTVRRWALIGVPAVPTEGFAGTPAI